MSTKKEDPLSTATKMVDWPTILANALAYVGKEAVDLVKTIASLEKSEQLLVEEMESLKTSRDAFEGRIRWEEQRQGRPRGQEAQDWLAGVDKFNESVVEFHKAFGQRRCCLECCCPCSLPPGLQLSWCVADMRSKIQRLQGRISDIPLTSVEILATRHTVHYGPKTFGADETLDQIRASLESADVSLIGIYGMGGSGKTTLLKRILYEYHNNHGRDIEVIYAEMTQQMDIQQLRADITRWLDVLGRDAHDAKSLEDIISSKTIDSQKRFILLLDNIWQKVDLADVGIPVPDSHNRCKIIFTTRSLALCTEMGAHPIKVGLLKGGDARKLFMTKLNSDIRAKRGLACYIDDVVAECGGLPLVLNVVGQAMAAKNDVVLWMDDIERLKSFPNQLQGMKDVFERLRFCYDNLTSRNLRHCFLYCSLFPDKHDIDIEELIAYWFAEGILCNDHQTINSEERGNLKRAQILGRDFVENLVNACLLEKGNYAGQVRMHDVIRDMALWIAENEFFVGSRFESSVEPPIWDGVEKISLMGNCEITLPPDSHDSLNLSTLLFNGNPNLIEVPGELLNYKGSLRVLDLSGTGITELPQWIGELLNLQYLNLSKTLITSLREEVGNLTSLTQIDLSYTSQLAIIPAKAISTLIKLRSVNVFKSNHQRWKRNDSNTVDGERGLTYDDLAQLKKLEELGLDVKEPWTLQRFLMPGLWDVTTRLNLTGVDGLAPDQINLALRRRNHLKELHIVTFKASGELELWGSSLIKLLSLKLFDLPQLNIIWKEVKTRRCTLVRLEIYQCHKLVDLGWVQYFMFLQFISLYSCDNLKELIPRDDGDEPLEVCFEALKGMTLQQLKNLKSICESPMMMPALELLTVVGCPELKELPLRDEDAKNIREVRGKKEWWNGLKWRLNAVMPNFRSYES